MARSTDDRRWITPPDDVRERLGNRYRIVELPTHVARFPVDEQPAAGLQEAVGDSIEDASVDDLKEEAREAVLCELRDGDDQRSARTSQALYNKHPLGGIPAT